MRKTRDYYSVKKQLVERRCRQCRRAFTPEYGDKRRSFCADTCLHRHHKRAHKRRYGTTYRKKARVLGVAYEPVNKLKVFARDRWRCQLCTVRTPKRLIGTIDPRAPELDHIIPMNPTTRGSHTYANVQLACRGCNGLKADRPLGQLRIA